MHDEVLMYVHIFGFMRGSCMPICNFDAKIPMSEYIYMVGLVTGEFEYAKHVIRNEPRW